MCTYCKKAEKYKKEENFLEFFRITKNSIANKLIKMKFIFKFHVPSLS